VHISAQDLGSTLHPLYHAHNVVLIAA